MALIVLVFLIAPLIELYVIIQVAHVIGGWQTLAFLIVESLIGAWLLKRQGLATLNRIGTALDEGRIPGRELIDGFLILVAGALMLAPGFITDLIGFLLLIPPSRALFRSVLHKRFAAGTYGRFFTVGRSGTRFVGTFRAGPVTDTTGHAARPAPRPELDS